MPGDWMFGVDDADPVTAQRQPGGEVGREVRLAVSAR
jgi:hypothetical protein